MLWSQLADDPRLFWNRVLVGDGCWEWQGPRNHAGYGRVGVDRSRLFVHRVSLYLWNGTEVPPWPEAEVGHHCDNPPCVRPDHLFVGTHADNMRDAQIKGRIPPPPRSQFSRDLSSGSCVH